MNDSIEAAEVLERAADVLFVQGRTTGTGRSGEAVCVEGAICVAQGLEPEEWSNRHVDGDLSIAALQSYLRRMPHIWNDELSVTPENDALVIDTLKRCAKELRALNP